MTDLTEQWKKGELPEGYYYIKHRSWPERTIDRKVPGGWAGSSSFFISEVLAPVPSYDEYTMTKECLKMLFEAAQRETILKKQLTIAVEVLWKVVDCREDREYYSEIAEKALEQIEELDK